ncbi:hypothetical protein RirG_164970 [Rhizophagus irregularis DAOM 197198w]|uniref:Uncharacterized protein n=1 Tax=Rhizophagus irregularis (strain DAOM 197198w) TaxID=1432141 RepID=A0A015K3T7_RHIIW|nr:hypothetical protein RirG_164970 [Rhizophagus irregularis DAOM 197198w]
MTACVTDIHLTFKISNLKRISDQQSVGKEKIQCAILGDEMEVDEEEARAEMKTILKTFLIELELIYDEKFSSESNDEILRQIIP